MGLMNFDVNIKNIKMRSYCRHLCLYILLFSVIISFANAEDQSEARNDDGGSGNADHFNRPNYIQLNTKNNNRNLSEFSVRKPQTQHHHHQNYHHHLRHQNSHNSEHRSKTNGNQHKQHVHQSNDSAFNRIPGYQRQAYSSKKHSHHEDDNSSASSVGGGFHTKTHVLHHQQRLTTLGPFRNRSYNRSGSWSSSGETSNKRNWSDNLSRNRQAPVELVHSSMNRNRTPYHQYNSYMRSHHTTTKRPTTTTTTTTTTTVAPDYFQEKVFFDAQNSFNNIDSDDDDNFDYNFDDDNDYDSDENFDTKKRSPSIGSFDRHHKKIQQSNENFQRDDPVRSSNGYNGITTTNTFKSQHSSNNDNYQLNVNNDGSINDRRTTIETSKSFVEPNLTTRTGVSVNCSFVLSSSFFSSSFYLNMLLLSILRTCRLVKIVAHK